MNIHILANKFWNYPIHQKNFIRDGAPYPKDDLVQVEKFFRTKIYKLFNLKGRKDIKEIYLLFEWRSKDTKEVKKKTKRLFTQLCQVNKIY